MAVDVASTRRVLRPQRRVGDSTDVSTDDDLNAEWSGLAGNKDVRIGQRHDMVRHDVGGLLEPPGRQLVQHLALVGHPGDDPIECRQPVRGDEEPLP